MAFFQWKREDAKVRQKDKMFPQNNIIKDIFKDNNKFNKMIAKCKTQFSHYGIYTHTLEKSIVDPYIWL